MISGHLMFNCFSSSICWNCFDARVPRSLIPGARSSRLKDRQKEERELLVKQAFIEDMLNENNLLSVLLGKGSTYRAVLWDPESLPSSTKEPQLSTEIATVSTKPRENISQVENEDNSNQNDLFDKMSLYIENVNDLYLDDDDLLCDFQVDSGTLACVACGILGFPFMSVVQPSDRASMEFLHADHPLVEDRAGDTETMKSYCPSAVHGTSKGPVSGIKCTNFVLTPFFFSFIYLLLFLNKFFLDYVISCFFFCLALVVT